MSRWTTSRFPSGLRLTLSSMWDEIRVRRATVLTVSPSVLTGSRCRLPTTGPNERVLPLQSRRNPWRHCTSNRTRTKLRWESSVRRRSSTLSSAETTRTGKQASRLPLCSSDFGRTVGLARNRLGKYHSGSNTNFPVMIHDVRERTR